MGRIGWRQCSFRIRALDDNGRAVRPGQVSVCGEILPTIGVVLEKVAYRVELPVILSTLQMRHLSNATVWGGATDLAWMRQSEGSSALSGWTERIGPSSAYTR
jgi:hypothetical protein